MLRCKAAALFFVPVFAGFVLAACGITNGPGSADAGAPDLATKLIPSGCPTPGTVTPAQVGAPRFLIGEDVFYDRTVDGDTAHFLLTSGDKTVRFLWVNTEEKSGAETTAFGQATVPIVEGWLQAAKIPRMVPEADEQNPTQPNLDIYDRTLALVFLDGELLQTRIVREGLSAYYTQFGCAPSPVHESLLYAEAEARANKRGIWASGHPTDYAAVFDRWIGTSCRPNPFKGQAYCP